MTFIKGQVANPLGRPRKVKAWVADWRKLTPKIKAKLESIIARGEDRDAVSAAKLLLAYAWGTPNQVVAIDINQTTSITVTQAERASYIEMLAAKPGGIEALKLLAEASAARAARSND